MMHINNKKLLASRFAQTMVIITCLIRLDISILQAQRERESDELDDIVSFILQIPEDDYDYEKARSFTPTDCDRVLPLLKDLEYERYWENIIAVIGISGDQRHIPDLLKFRELGSGKEEMSIHEYVARIDVSYAIGLMGNRGINAATDILVEWAASENIPEIKGNYNGRTVASYDVANRKFITALSITGSTGAERELQKMKIEWESNPAYVQMFDRAIERVKRLRTKNYVDILEENQKERFGILQNSRPEPEEPARNYPDLTDEEWIVEAIKQYREISTAYLTGPLADVIPRLADDGDPIDFSSPRKRENREAYIDAVVAAQASNTSTGRITAVVNELPLERLAEEGNAEVIREKEMVIVKVKCPGTREALRPLIPDRWRMMYEGVTIIPSHGGFTPEWDAMIYMIYKNGNWYWNAYGW